MDPAPHPEVSAWLFRIGHDLQVQRRNRDTHALRPRAQLMGLGYFIGKHLDQETLGLAAEK